MSSFAETVARPPTSRRALSLDTPRAKNFALALLAVTQFVIVIDGSIVNVASPSIGAHLHFSSTDLSWVINAYVLTFGGFLLLGGRLADLLGRRRMFMLGLIVFSLASLAAGVAQSEAWLLATRALQGVGAAIVSPAALSILTSTFADGAERNRALGIWGAVLGAGGSAGVLLGGVLTSGLSWRWVMLVPTTLAGIGFGLAFVPITIAAMAGTEPQEAGLGSGLIDMSQQIGGALGVSHPGDARQQPHPKPDPRRRPSHRAPPHQGI